MASGDVTPNLIRPFNGTVDAAGDLQVTWTTGSHLWNWEIKQVSLSMASAPAGAVAAIYLNGNLVSPAPSPRRASAAGLPYIMMRPGDEMYVLWESCTTGDQGLVTVYLDQILL